jgi:tetratricopeptide (TPR) repeat protein
MMELLLNAENALALGLLDSAERTYRTVLEADPRNGIAAVGLSRVALERGDEAGAVALAQAALEIDSENATARRMIDRLEEVARFRDAAPAAPAAAAPATPAPATSLPNDTPNHPPPARPGLLGRILRRS